MGLVIGIDVGGSTTKIVGIRDGAFLSPLMVRANDPIASIFGAFGKFTSENHIPLKDISRVMVTGAGSTFVDTPLYGLPTGYVDEFIAIGLGGRHMSGIQNPLVVSMGTGTSFVRVNGNQIRHIGGTGIGGGTITGLAGTMLNVREVETLSSMAREGNLQNIDLMVCDFITKPGGNLTPDTTAANFGKIKDVATKNDFALGILNLVFQTIGMMAVFAVGENRGEPVVLTGNLTTIPQAKEIMDHLSSLFHFSFLIPEHAQFATAVGAALAAQDSSYFRIIE